MNAVVSIRAIADSTTPMPAPVKLINERHENWNFTASASIGIDVPEPMASNQKTAVNCTGIGNGAHVLLGWELKDNTEELNLVHTAGITKQRYKCYYCSYSTARKSNLVRHMKTHRELFKFHCSNCLQGFPNEMLQQAHERLGKLGPKRHSQRCH